MRPSQDMRRSALDSLWRFEFVAYGFVVDVEDSKSHPKQLYYLMYGTSYALTEQT